MNDPSQIFNLKRRMFCINTSNNNKPLHLISWKCSTSQYLLQIDTKARDAHFFKTGARNCLYSVYLNKSSTKKRFLKTVGTSAAYLSFCKVPVVNYPGGRGGCVAPVTGLAVQPTRVVAQSIQKNQPCFFFSLTDVCILAFCLIYKRDWGHEMDWNLNYMHG